MGDAGLPAMGRPASIGMLYDAKSDRFLAHSIFTKHLAPLVSTKLEVNIATALHQRISYETAFKALAIDRERGLNFLCGLVHPRGASAFLHDFHRNDGQNDMSIVTHRVLTAQQTLEEYSVFSKVDILELESLAIEDFTHVVTGISWGLDIVVSVTQHASDSPDSGSDRESFDLGMQSLKAAIEAATPSSRPPSCTGLRNCSVTLYSDVLQNDGLVMENEKEVHDFIQLIPYHIKQEGHGQGWPLSYTMIPIELLRHLTPQLRTFPIGNSTMISLEILSGLMQFFDDVRTSKAGLQKYRGVLMRHRPYVADSHLEEVVKAILHLDDIRKWAMEHLRDMLVDVRRGQKEPWCLMDLLDQFTSSDSPVIDFASLAWKEKEKLEFIDIAISKGATYVGHKGMSTDMIQEIQKEQERGFYVFHFSTRSMHDEAEWMENHALLMEILDCPNDRMPVYILDYEAVGTEVSVNVSISQHTADGTLVPNLLERKQFLSSNCLARYHDEGLDTAERERPIKRGFVKIPCPCQAVDPICVEWKCPVCFRAIEYGFTDSFLYCDCGRCLYSSYEFKCNREAHGSGYQEYDAERLHGLLKGLDQSNYVNILIMGETGVGKSTFINSFVNYLSFSTLEEAKEAEGLVSVIPCSFSIQTMDRDRPEVGIQEYNIKVGTRDDETDGSSGESATQKTAVYPVTIGSKTYRLIDTPGIGDTRGTSFDKKNMADLLATISSYDVLHGILILLKSNNARLTITFRFCVQELLAHLHKSATAAMAFGFTNTRISNFAPGDTFKPLRTLLDAHADVGLSLTTSTTYCFDSEAFRYLAACKQDVHLENQEDFRRSWDHSRKEALRLVDYFASTSPHPVASTLSLNGTRALISQLTTPMAKISELVVKNLAFAENQKTALVDSRLTTAALREKLLIEKIQFVARALNRPRTVCKRIECCDFKDSGKGDGEVITIYKTHCHAECFLQGVTKDVVADPGLVQCWAFQGGNSCQICGHQWQEHLHVLYELDEMIVKVEDQEIQRQLRDNADDLTLRQTAINKLDTYIEESKQELDEIRLAAARFCLFLRDNAITPVNDATLEYLDMLIKEEKNNVEVGQQRHMSVQINKSRLAALEADKQDHLQLVQTLEQNAREPKGPEDVLLDQHGVERLVNRLYGLKHFGANLHDVKYVIESSIEGTNRERPFRVPTGTKLRAHHRRSHGRERQHMEDQGKQGRPNTESRHEQHRTYAGVARSYGLQGHNVEGKDGGERHGWQRFGLGRWFG